MRGCLCKALPGGHQRDDEGHREQINKHGGNKNHALRLGAQVKQYHTAVALVDKDTQNCFNIHLTTTGIRSESARAGLGSALGFQKPF